MAVKPKIISNRPKTRADCSSIGRPCPFVGCRYHLFLHVNPSNGAIKFHFPKKEVLELKETCALDNVKPDGLTLKEIAVMINCSRERVRQVQDSALAKIRKVIARNPNECGDIDMSSASTCESNWREMEHAVQSKRLTAFPWE